MFDWEAPPRLETLRGVGKISEIVAVRDDTLRGGSKSRFLWALCRGQEEVVYAGPFCGGAPVALAVLGRDMGFRATLFYAGRKRLHPRQEQASRSGAKIVPVWPGYMTVVQKRARDYAEVLGALFLGLGFDSPEAEEPFVEVMRGVRAEAGDPDQVWCATGSGMLARCLGAAFPKSKIKGVTVGLKSRHGAQEFPPNVQLWPQPLRFEQEAPRLEGWFDMCPNYDRKAFLEMLRFGQGRCLFWNVMGDAREVR